MALIEVEHRTTKMFRLQISSKEHSDGGTLVVFDSFQLRQDFLYNVSTDIGQPETPALRMIRQPLMIYSQHVEHSRVHVMNLD